MATITLFLNGATGYVYHMNSLTMEFYQWWAFGRKYGLPYLVELTKEDVGFTDRQQKQIQSMITPLQKEEINWKAEQLSLFD